MSVVVRSYDALDGGAKWESDHSPISTNANLKAGMAIIRIAAAGLNFFDVLMCQGKYQVKPELPFVPGVEFAGTVEAMNGPHDHIKVGTRVFGIATIGAFADHICVPIRTLMSVPKEMSFDVAAGFGMVYATSYLGIVERGEIRPGMSVVVLAAGGGVGLAAVQIAKAHGAKVIGVVGSDHKIPHVLAGGADYVLNYRSDKKWHEQVPKLLGGKGGADIVFDPVGGQITRDALKCIAFNGKLLIIGFASGVIPSIPFNLLLLKSCSVVGVFWGGAVQRQPSLYSKTFHSLFQLYEAGKIKPLISERFPMSQIQKAMERISSRASVGKIVLIPDSVLASRL